MVGNINSNNVMRFADRYAIGCEKGMESKHFLRVSIPGGVLTTEQFRDIANISEKYGKKYAEITSRQDIQMHWIKGMESIEIFEKLEKIGFTTDFCGQWKPMAHFGDVRNVVGCPASGVDKFELIDCLPFINKVKKFLAGNRDFLDLPRKFKISISGCPKNCVSPEIQDLALVATKNENGEVGFVAFLGGGTGTPPHIGKPLGVFIHKEDYLEVIKALLQMYRDIGPRDSKARSRFKFFVDKMGIDWIRENLQNVAGGKLDKFNQGALDTSGNEHIGINPQKADEYCYINYPIQNGELTSAQMLKIAEIAETYGSSELRLTPFQNLIFTGVEWKNTSKIIQEMRSIGLPFNDFPLAWTALSCRAAFCRLAVTSDSTSARTREIVHYLEERFGAKLHALNLKLSVSGCPSACSRFPIADIGLQAMRIRDSNSTIEGYNLYLGGGLGTNPSFGRLVKRAVPTAELDIRLGNIIERFTQKKTGDETFRSFCQRQSVNELVELME
jgi:sulfite reductase beta subunit-like hemoprotein